MPSRSRSRLWGWNMTFSRHAFLPQPQRASLQLGSVDWLGSWVDVYIAVFILFGWWDMPPEVARLTGNARGTRQMTASLFFRAIQGDLSHDDRPRPVIYLLTALMWEKWGAVVMGADKRQGECEGLPEGKIWQTLCVMTIPTAILYIPVDSRTSLGPVISSIQGKKPDLHSRNFRHSTYQRGWGVGAKPLSLSIKWIWIEIFFLRFNFCGILWLVSVFSSFGFVFGAHLWTNLHGPLSHHLPIGSSLWLDTINGFDEQAWSICWPTYFIYDNLVLRNQCCLPREDNKYIWLLS